MCVCLWFLVEHTRWVRASVFAFRLCLRCVCDDDFPRNVSGLHHENVGTHCFHYATSIEQVQDEYNYINKCVLFVCVGVFVDDDDDDGEELVCAKQPNEFNTQLYFYDYHGI